ncbi:MAG: VTT domain-containing protein [Spirochaetales bacterium]
MENSTKPAAGWQKWVGPALLGAVLLSLLVWMALNWGLVWGLATDPQKIRAWMQPFGVWAPVVYVAMNFVLGVTVIMPGEVPMIAGGFLFGAFWGTVWATLGAGLATVFCFFIARKLGLSFVQKVFGKEHVEKFEPLVSGPKALIVFFFLFLIPGLPKHILSYLGGLTRLNLWVFLAVSLIGHTPALVGAMLIGEAAATENWTVALAISALAGGCLLVGVIFRKPLMAWLEKLAPGADSPGS